MTNNYTDSIATIAEKLNSNIYSYDANATGKYHHATVIAELWQGTQAKFQYCMTFAQGVVCPDESTLRWYEDAKSIT